MFLAYLILGVKIMRSLLIATTELLLAACSQTPDWDYDQSANFSNFKTFAWVKDASLTKGVENSISA